MHFQSIILRLFRDISIHKIYNGSKIEKFLLWTNIIGYDQMAIMQRWRTKQCKTALRLETTSKRESPSTSIITILTTLLMEIVSKNY